MDQTETAVGLLQIVEPAVIPVSQHITGKSSVFITADPRFVGMTVNADPAVVLIHHGEKIGFNNVHNLKRFALFVACGAGSDVIGDLLPDKHGQAEIEKAVEKAKKEAEKTAKEEVAKATADMKDEIEELQDKNTRLEMWSNEDLTEFRVQTKVMQEVCNDCMTVIARVSAKDKDKALKMAEGLKTILATKIESVNGLLS